MLEWVHWKWKLSNEQLYFDWKSNCKYKRKSILVKYWPYPVYVTVTMGDYGKLWETTGNFLYQSLLLNNLTKSTKKDPSY